MKVAIVHDFLLKLGGAERVVNSLSKIFPEAPIYTLLYDEEKVGKIFPKDKVITSSLQKYPKFIRNRYRYLLSKMPRAIEELDFRNFDLVISSSSAYSHGIITSLDTRHICYCHSPMRYAWDWTHEYREENKIRGLKSLFVTPLLKKIRIWDQIAADRPDQYIANSKYISNRIKKYFQQDSKVIYPPVEIERFKASKNHSDYFLIVSTLTPYKKIDLAIQLFNKIGRKLVIIGEGSHRKQLENISGPNIEFLGFVDDDTAKEYMENCRAFIFPGEEDFGIAPVEAMACGKPVLAFGKGGLLETVIPGKTGEFFYDQNLNSMEDALARLLHNESFYDYKSIRKHAEQFSEEQFINNIKKLIGI
ncbi:glycosyltransferase [Patescibacteria group bacterium]